jgi:hypothetical protein
MDNVRMDGGRGDGRKATWPTTTITTPATITHDGCLYDPNTNVSSQNSSQQATAATV